MICQKTLPEAATPGIEPYDNLDEGSMGAFSKVRYIIPFSEIVNWGNYFFLL